MPKFVPVQPRYRPGRRVAATALAAVALVCGAAAAAPQLTAHGAVERARQVDAVTMDNGTVADNGSGAAVYDYPGDGTAPDTSLTTLGSLADGTQVSIQCYLTGTPVTGPNGLGSGGSDVYWDQIDGAGAGLAAQVPAGHTAIVPDAYIQTSTPVDQLVPACGSGSSAPAPPAAGTGTPAASGACPDVYVVFARGTSEPQDQNMGLASVGQPFVDALRADLPGKTVQAYGAQFNADWTQAHTLDGANDMENYVQTQAAQCPDAKFVLGGYSQGAAAVDATLGLGPVLAPAYGTAAALVNPALGPVAGALLAAQPGLPDSLAGRIAAVVTFGNPIHWANQSIATASQVYGPVSDDFCNAQDPICANGTAFPDPLATHKQYATNGSAQQGAQFAADEVNAAG